MHLEIVAWGDWSKVHAAIIIVHVQDNRPTVEPRLGAAGRRIEEDDSIPANWSIRSRSPSNRPRPPFVFPDINAVAIWWPLTLVHLVQPHCHNLPRALASLSPTEEYPMAVLPRHSLPLRLWRR